jgi:hypothetical protein
MACPDLEQNMTFGKVSPFWGDFLGGFASFDCTAFCHDTLLTAKTIQLR